MLESAIADLGKSDPGAYAKLIEDLRAGGTASLPLGGALRMPANAPAPRSDAELLQAAFEQKITPGNDKTGFAAKFKRLHELLEADPAGQQRLARLLVSGALGNVGDAGEPVIDSLIRIADKGEGALQVFSRTDPDKHPEIAALRAALTADTPGTIGKLLERLAPGPDDASPRAMFARSAPGSYVQLVADVALVGEANVSRQSNVGNAYYAEGVLADHSNEVPPVDVVAFVVDLGWLQSDRKAALDPRYQALLRSLGGQPEARTALALLAKQGKFDAKGYYAPGGYYRKATKTQYPQRENPLDALARLADPGTPLAAGIDRSSLLAEVVKGLATPYPTINQGEWQTCTVATIQRLYAESRPDEYVRVITGLASPGGKVRLAVGKGRGIARPSDWAASSGDNRTTVNRLFQSAMISNAVQDYNKRILDEAGFQSTAADTATYSNAKDEWTDPFGNRRRGLPPEAVGGLASQLEGKEYASVEIPQALASLVTPNLLEQAVLAFPDRDTASGLSDVAMTLELTAEDGTPFLHEVLLGNMTKGPPPLAALIDPSDGRTRQVEAATLAMSLRSIAFPKETLANLVGGIGSGIYDGFLGSLLDRTGDTGKVLLAGVLPMLLPSMIKADVGDKPFKPAIPPAGAPDAGQLAPILGPLAGERPPVGRFALHDLIRAGGLDQRTKSGRKLLADLAGIASGEVELPEGVLREDALREALLDAADGLELNLVALPDAGGKKGRRSMPDAGGKKGRRSMPDAGGKKGRRSMPDAGGKKGRKSMADAGIAPGNAIEFLG